MMTESEAKTKACHRTMFPANTGVTLRATNCIASECMAWRWFDSMSDDGTQCHAKPSRLAARVPQTEPGLGLPLDQRRGYCGIAGAPSP